MTETCAILEHFLHDSTQGKPTGDHHAADNSNHCAVVPKFCAV